MALPDADELTQDEEVQEETEDARDAWLTFALADPDGGAAALATAARGGRPLRKKD
jgi:hypothetical protein